MVTGNGNSGLPVKDKSWTVCAHNNLSAVTPEQLFKLDCWTSGKSFSLPCIIPRLLICNES